MNFKPRRNPESILNLRIELFVNQAFDSKYAIKLRELPGFEILLRVKLYFEFGPPADSGHCTTEMYDPLMFSDEAYELLLAYQNSPGGTNNDPTY